MIVSHSWMGPGRFEDRTASYARLVREIADAAADLAPQARFTTAGLELGEAFAWTMGLLGLGAAVLMLLSITAGAAALGLALAARLVFLLILMMAVLPWVKGGGSRLDPRALPQGLLSPT
ncbi:MAG: hypothetical protein Q8L66_07110 [Caulobacter sp.]|nr:hypothetical protein [Caulobacter sp.]